MSQDKNTQLHERMLTIATTFSANMHWPSFLSVLSSEAVFGVSTEI